MQKILFLLYKNVGVIIKKLDRVGEISLSNQGENMEILEYFNKNNMTIRFKSGNIKHNVRYNEFKKGSVKNIFYPSVEGIGYIGEGKYKVSESCITTVYYQKWNSMIKRCYNPKEISKYPTYSNCIVCDEWLNFQKFAEWCDKNYYEIEGQVMCLDKDILVKGNKIYSPNTCIFVPNIINVIFTKTNKNRGQYPIGVTYSKYHDKYSAICQHPFKNRSNHLGYFNNYIDAFYAYKKEKELVIKEVAEFYKINIPKKLYSSLIKYRVDITD